MTESRSAIRCGRTFMKGLPARSLGTFDIATSRASPKMGPHEGGSVSAAVPLLALDGAGWVWGCNVRSGGVCLDHKDDAMTWSGLADEGRSSGCLTSAGSTPGVDLS